MIKSHLKVKGLKNIRMLRRRRKKKPISRGSSGLLLLQCILRWLLKSM
jgi:hypothetical protein